MSTLPITIGMQITDRRGQTLTVGTRFGDHGARYSFTTRTLGLVARGRTYWRTGRGVATATQIMDFGA